MRKNEVK